MLDPRRVDLVVKVDDGHRLEHSGVGGVGAA
jgi:hypothetical protein